MEDDIVTMAENKLDTLLQSDDGAPDDQTPPTGDEDQTPPENEESQEDQNNDNQEGEGDQDDGQTDADSQEEESGEDQENQGGEGQKQSDEDGGSEDEETPKQLSDEEFLAELERRGLKASSKDDKDDKSDDDQPKDTPLQRPAELPEQVWSGMGKVQQYIYRELPYITIQGKDGNKISIKTPEQMPEDFEYANAREERIAADAFNEQSRRADSMYGQIRNHSQTQQQQRQQAAEKQEIISGVDELQGKGIVPKITAKPGTDEFDNDPGVIRANEILKYRQELINKGEKISVYSAGLQYKALHPELYQTKQTKSKGDAERKSKSRNISGGGRGSQQSASNKNKRPQFPVGTSASDIADYYGSDLD